MNDKRLSGRSDKALGDEKEVVGDRAAGDEAEARGGKGNPPLIIWDLIFIAIGPLVA